MICKCCYKDASADNASCPVCGFPLMTISDESHKAEMEKAIADYRLNLLKPYSISVKTFTYSFDNGNLTAPKVKSIKLCDASELKYNVLVWSDREFAPVTSKRAFPLELEISDGGTSRSVMLNVSSEEAISHTHIGIALSDALSVKVAVGTKDKFVYTEPVSLIK